MGKTMNVGSGKTLNTGPKDRIFVYFADHGGPGLSQFGNSSHGLLYATNLTDTLNAMHKGKQYSEMVLYWESCNSGSMFLNLSTEINVYALSASNATQSSFACYCAPMFWGKSNVHCFGDCFSIHWMEDADDENLQNETLLIQFWITRHETDMNHYRKYEISHVEQWGSVAKMNNEKMSKYLGTPTKESYIHYQHPTSFNGDNSRGMAIPQPEIALEVLKMEYKNAKSNEEKSIAGDKLQELKNKREMFHGKIGEIMQSVVKIGKEDGIFNKNQEHILENNDFNVVLTRSQYESCFYPLIQTFQDRCFSFACNDYVIYQMKKFLPLCKADVPQDIIVDAMKTNCSYPKPMCGIN
jgi:legumain